MWGCEWEGARVAFERAVVVVIVVNRAKRDQRGWFEGFMFVLVVVSLRLWFGCGWRCRCDCECRW